MNRQPISTDGAPPRSGRTARRSTSVTSCSAPGQLGIDPATGELAGGVEAQTERAMKSLGGVLDAAGLGFADVVKTTCFLADIGDFAAFNAIYARFIDPPPARSTFAGRGAAARAPGSRSRRSPGASRPTPSPARRMDAQRSGGARRPHDEAGA